MIFADVHCTRQSPPTPPLPRDTGKSETSLGPIKLATPVLVVEDESMIAWMIEDLLAEAGFGSIIIASDGDRALAEAAKRQPGLIVSDVNLGPGADGIVTAQRIREGSDVPVIFVTAYADDALRARLADEMPGAQLLRKPLDPSALIRAARRALGN